MLIRTKWRVVEEACRPGEADARWSEARAQGAVGAVTSWGAGISNRETLRLYWELNHKSAPEGEDLVEENWTPYWRETFRTTPVSRTLTLVPAWVPPPTEGRCLRLDPGMAFGAGDHPTTRLCLQLLEQHASSGGLPQSFLDIGSGTGVLALAAVTLGAGRADALDIDPFGYAACRRNARLNGLERQVSPVLLSLDLHETRYALAAANIVAGQLDHMAPLLRERVAPGGTLLISGFEDSAETRVTKALSWPVTERLVEEGWVALALRAPPRSP